MNNTGENTEGLRKVVDLTRQISLVLLIMHFYFYCYAAFRQWGLSHPISDKFLLNLHSTGLFNHNYISKLAALLFLLISLIGAKVEIPQNSYRSALVRSCRNEKAYL